MILTINDFDNGRYQIPTNPKQDADLMACIQYVEDFYLPKLFGVELYELFLDDLSLPVAGEPTDPRFIKIFNAFNYQSDESCNELVRSEGIKEMLKGIVYYHYVRDEPTRVTTVGIKRTKSDNSTNVTAIKHDITSRLNQAVVTYKSIQFYICYNTDFEYPEFKGVEQKYNHQF